MASQTNNPWFAATIGLGGLIVGYIIANGMNGVALSAPSAQNQPTPPSSAAAAVPAPAPTNNTPPTAGDSPSIGKANASVTVIEFTDFQCPFCGRNYTDTYGKIKQNYIDTGKVRYVIRNFPLSFHQFAQKGAEATMCANEQSKFWDMHDKLFSNQATWSALPDAVPTFKQYAKDIGLNTTQFNSCIDGDKYKDAIAKDEADGSAAGINGTPGFWILGPNGQHQLISGAYPYETFSAAIDGMLK